MRFGGGSRSDISRLDKAVFRSRSIQAAFVLSRRVASNRAEAQRLRVPSGHAAGGSVGQPTQLRPQRLRCQGRAWVGLGGG